MADQHVRPNVLVLAVLFVAAFFGGFLIPVPSKLEFVGQSCFLLAPIGSGQ